MIFPFAGPILLKHICACKKIFSFCKLGSIFWGSCKKCCHFKIISWRVMILQYFNKIFYGKKWQNIKCLKRSIFMAPYTSVEAQKAVLSVIWRALTSPRLMKGLKYFEGWKIRDKKRTGNPRRKKKVWQFWRPVLGEARRH